MIEASFGRKVTRHDRNKACRALATALGYSLHIAHPNWLDVKHGEGKGELFSLMAKYDIWPSSSPHIKSDYVYVRWGPHNELVRIVPMAEHPTKEDAIAYAVVLALTSFLESEYCHAT